MEELIKNELDFYSKFARPLIINLPESTDRALASGWVKKILDENVGPIKLRTDYLKLLLFALQRQKLAGIFADDPSKYEKLEDFPEEYDLNEMAKRIIEKEQADRQDRIRRQLRGQEGDFPPYTTDFSADFREYVAAQDIPGFGVHCYYAISKDPIITWRQVDKSILPKMAKSAVDTTSPLPPGVTSTSSDPACVCPTLGEEVSDKEEVCRTSRLKSPEAPKKKKRKFGRQPPSHMLGKVVPPDDDREPPSWGTNLVEVKDIPKFDAEEPEVAPVPSKGAIPKRKMGAVRIPVDDDTTMVELEEAVREFRRGEINLSPKKRRRGLDFGETTEYEEDFPQQPGYEGTPYQAEAGALYPADVYIPDEIDPESLRREQEIAEDEEVIEHFKRELKKADARKKVSEVAELAQASLPAKARIPVTTPRTSTSPKRPQSSEKLYQQKEPLPDVGDVAVSPGKDYEMARLQAQVEAAAESEAAETSIMTHYEQQQEQEAQIQQQIAHMERQEQAIEEGAPQSPIQRGSPGANIIISEYISARDAPQEDILPFEELEYLPLSPQKPGLETPPPFSRDQRIRDAAQEMRYSGMEDVQWQHAPDYLKGTEDEEDYRGMADRRHLRRQQLERIRKPREFTEQQQKVIEHPILREQYFFDIEEVPDEFENVEDLDEAIRQADLWFREQCPAKEPPKPASPAMSEEPVTPEVLQESREPEEFREPKGPPRYLSMPRPKYTSLEPMSPMPQRSPHSPFVPRPPLEYEPFVTPENIREQLRQTKPPLPPLPVGFDMGVSPSTPREPPPVVSPETREKLLQHFIPDLHQRVARFKSGVITPPRRPPTPPTPPSPPTPPCSPARPMIPQQAFPQSPSFLVAERGSPAMLKDLAPQQVYGVEPLESSMLSPQINIDEYEFGDFLDERIPHDFGEYVKGPEGSPDVGKYLLEKEYLDDDLGGLEDIAGEEFIDISPPPSPATPPPLTPPVPKKETPPYIRDPILFEMEMRKMRIKTIEDMMHPSCGYDVGGRLDPNYKHVLPLKKKRPPVTEKEKEYILEAFGDDQEKREIFLEMCENPDWDDAELSPAFQNIPSEKVDLFEESFPEDDFELLPNSPEPPEQMQPTGYPVRAEVLHRLPCPGSGVPGPSGLQAPRGVSRPSGKAAPRGIPQPSGIRPPGGARPSGIPPPTGRTSGIPPPKGRVSGIPPPKGRVSGIPPPKGRPSGIPQKGGAPPSRLRPPGASRIVPPGRRQMSGLARPPVQVQTPPRSPIEPPPPCSPCSPVAPAQPTRRSPPMIAVTEATPEWLASMRDVPEFYTAYGQGGVGDLFAESMEFAKSPPLPTPERLQAQHEEELFASQYATDHDFDIYGGTPPLDESLISPELSPMQEDRPVSPIAEPLESEFRHWQEPRWSEPKHAPPPSSATHYERFKEAYLRLDPILSGMEKLKKDDRAVDEMLGLVTPRGIRKVCRGRRIDFETPAHETIVEESVPPELQTSLRPSPIQSLRPSPCHSPRTSPDLFGAVGTEEGLAETDHPPMFSPTLFDTETPEGGLAERVPPQLVRHPLDESPISGLAKPLIRPWFLSGYVTPPHIHELERRTPPPGSPYIPYFRGVGDTVELPHELQLRLQKTPDSPLGEVDIDLFDDANLPPRSPPPPRSPEVPSPPTPPPRTPSPRAADIFREAGVEFSPRSRALGAPLRRDDFFIPRFRPAWLREQLSQRQQPGSPERTVTQRSSEQRYVIQFPPEETSQQKNSGRQS